jgi:hypothetical protein
MLTIIDEDLAVDLNGILSVKKYDDPMDQPAYGVIVYKERNKSNEMIGVEQHVKIMEILKERKDHPPKTTFNDLASAFSAPSGYTQHYHMTFCQFGDPFPCKHKECQ